MATQGWSMLRPPAQMSMVRIRNKSYNCDQMLEQKSITKTAVSKKEKKKIKDAHKEKQEIKCKQK